MPFAENVLLPKGQIIFYIVTYHPSNVSCNFSIYSYLASNYVTKHFGIFQMVIKSQRLHMST